MARTANKLTAKQVQSLKEPGRHSDGDGLYLKIASGGSKSWVLMMSANGTKRELGLGSLKEVSLAQARVKAGEYRQKLKSGIDPRRSGRTIPTFGEMAELYIQRNSPSWRNAKHREQWPSTLSVQRTPDGKWLVGGYCIAIRDLPVNQIDTPRVIEVLEPIWHSKQETAGRVRQRIQAVLDAAAVAGYREGQNPAAWDGHLEQMLPARPKASRKHHAAMPYKELPAFVQKLHLIRGTGAFALEFAILTAARSGEVRHARWDEIDLDAQIWTVPAERMKAGRVHRVPLTSRALAILRTVSQFKAADDGFIFPGSKSGRPLSDMTLGKVIQRNVDRECTVHGFRSTFRDWVGEETDFARDVAEAALAHKTGDETEQAYRRGDALEKRRQLMAGWEEFCLGGQR